MQDIEKKEIDYWEEKFGRQAAESSGNLSSVDFNDRIYSRGKFLISRVKQFVSRSSRVLEIGGGNFRTIKALLDPDVYQYTFVGTDISFNGLMLGKQKVKNGAFVRCDVEHLPFSPGSFDLIFSFGVLHHTISLEKNLPELFRLLKKNGILVLHEPVSTQSHDHGSNLLRKIAKLFVGKNSRAPLDRKINFRKLVRCVDPVGEIIYRKQEYSSVRLLISRVFSRLLIRSATVMKLTVLIDDIAVGMSQYTDLPVLGGSGMMMIIRKLKAGKGNRQ